MKRVILTDELREEMRIRPDRADKYESIIARGEVLKDGGNVKDLQGDISDNV